MNMRRKGLVPFGMWIVFEIVAVTLWLIKDNRFYFLNFSYIGTSITVGLLLFQFNYKHARRIVQLLVGLYMLIYLGLICQENMQIEGFWYYLFTGVFEAATIHYAVAKIFGPLFLKPMSYFSVVRVKCDKEKCISCGKCKKVCPMNVDMTDNSRKRKNGTECILCMECVKTCPRKAL